MPGIRLVLLTRVPSAYAAPMAERDTVPSPGEFPEPGGPAEPSEGSAGSWADRRREAARERARMLADRQGAEHRRAARIVSLFLAVARAESLEPVPLRVKGYGGGTARTGLKGWYLRADETVGIDTEGRFYVLSQSLSLRERLLGAEPTSEPVPMTLGEGGRDGDIVPLRFALDRLLPGWEDRSPEPLA